MINYAFILSFFFLSACAMTLPGVALTETPAGAGSAATSALQPGTVINTPEPDVWGKFGLSGSMIFIIYNNRGNQVVRLDMASGTMTLIYQAPENSQLNAAMLSPDGKQLAVIYAPPPDNKGNYFFSSLYLMPQDGSGPLKAILPGDHPDDAYYNPAWTPDGEALYASHFHRGDGSKTDPDSYSIVRVTLDGKITPVIPGAIWPVISPDGSKLAYLSARVDNPQNDLHLADLSGANPKSLVEPGILATEDYHLFSPDGQNLYFSAVSLTTEAEPSSRWPSSASWWDQFLGIEVVSAHNLPSDLYKISLSGGAPVRLTKIRETGLIAAFSPDGQRLALLSQSHLYVLDPDGSGLQTLLNLVGFGTVQWVR